MAIVLTTSTWAGPAAAQASGALSLSPASGPVGSMVIAAFVVTGRPRGCGSTATFRWNGARVGEEPLVRSSVDCRAVSVYSVPSGPAGLHRVTAEASYSVGLAARSDAVSASADFIVVSSPSSRPTTPTSPTTPTAPTAPTRGPPSSADKENDRWWMQLVIAGGVVGVFVALVAVRWLVGRRSPTDLSGLMDRVLGVTGGANLARSGPASIAVADALGDPRRANALLSTLLWRSVANSERLAAELVAAGASSSAAEDGQLILVPHAGGERHDLLIFDPSWSGAEPLAIRLGSGQLADMATEVDVPRGGWFGASRLDPGIFREAVGEAARLGQFGVVVTSPPPMVTTGVPSPAWGVSVGAAGAAASVGLVARSKSGATVVTTALHAVEGHGAANVRGTPARVVSSDPATDSCVLELDIPIDVESDKSAGPLVGMTPRQDERAWFDGVASGRKETRVTGWDLSILERQPWLASKVYTRPDTVPGDSGSALVDRSGHILGFAVFVTAYGATTRYSSWAWADQVLEAHGLGFAEPDGNRF